MAADGAQPCEGLWLTDKIRAFIRKQAALLETAAGSKRGAILVSTGALNPVHCGHVAIMEQARQAVEAEGMASARACPPRAPAEHPPAAINSRFTLACVR
jgi:hypothetical protein